MLSWVKVDQDADRARKVIETSDQSMLLRRKDAGALCLDREVFRFETLANVNGRRIRRQPSATRVCVLTSHSEVSLPLIETPVDFVHRTASSCVSIEQFNAPRSIYLLSRTLVSGFDSIPTFYNICLETDGSRSAMQFQKESAGITEYGSRFIASPKRRS